MFRYVLAFLTNFQFTYWEEATWCHVLSSNSLFQGFDWLKSSFSGHKDIVDKCKYQSNINARKQDLQNRYRCNITMVRMLYLNSRHNINCYRIIHIWLYNTVSLSCFFFPSCANLYSVGQLWSLLKLN